MTASSSDVVVNYTYGNSANGDRLTSFNGEAISYDSSGRTVYYRGKAISYFDEDANAIQSIGNAYFTYDTDGMRASKTVNGVTHYYTYDGLKLIREEWGNNVLVFLYDASGSPIGMQYRNSSYATDIWDTYYYEKNLQGDILAVYNSTGTKLVSYYYDSWGYISDVAYSNGGGSTGAQYNPLRYRGYYYDDDLDLYYLATRYYDPETCRFVTADSYVSTGQGILGYNRYVYCGNNPVMRVDPVGESWRDFWANLADFSITIVSGTISIAGGLAVGLEVANATHNLNQAVIAGIESAMTINGAINNTVNALYYSISSSDFKLTETGDFSAYASDDGSFTYINRWNRLDHAKNVTRESYFGGGWEYYSEYSIHMYGWAVTSWALNKNIPLFSRIAESSQQAWIEESLMDGNEWYIILPTIFYGVFGGN